MTRNWTEWEGREVGGFPLEKFLGSSESGAVFRTGRGGEPAAIKLFPAAAVAAGAQLARWDLASPLSHPHLVRLFEHAIAKSTDGTLVYVVTEYAEEVLSQVDRPLTSAEALDMLAPALNALAYLHGKGFAHGRLKPSNILAIHDRLKLSGDAPLKIGERHGHSAMPQPYDAPEIEQKGVSPAADVWSLGMTLVEVLTQSRPAWDANDPRLPEALPESFREVARKCLRQDPAQRISVAELSQWLQSGAKASSSGSKRRYLIPAIAGAAVVAAGAIAIPYFQSSDSKNPADATPVASQQQPVSSAKPAEVVPPLDTNPSPVKTVKAPERPAAKESAPPPSPAPPEKPAPVTTRASNEPLPAGVVQQVLPEVPPKSRTTVHGKVPIMVRVQTDSSGAVTTATVEAGKLSTYFSDMSLKAARQWKFAPGDPHEWMLRFEYTRNAEHPVTVEATQR